MKQKALHTNKGKAIRRTVAAAVFATAFTIGGCGEFPQCPVYFRGEVAKQCNGFLGNMKVVKGKLKEVDGHREYTRDKLREKVVLENNMEGLDLFNRICDELEGINTDVARYRRLELRVKRGEATDGEVMGANEGVQEIIGKLDDIARELVSI